MAHTGSVQAKIYLTVFAVCRDICRHPRGLHVHIANAIFLLPFALSAFSMCSTLSVQATQFVVLPTRDQEMIDNGRRSLRMNVGRRPCILSVISVKIFRISSVADHVESSECVDFND